MSMKKGTQAVMERHALRPEKKHAGYFEGRCSCGLYLGTASTRKELGENFHQHMMNKQKRWAKP